MNIESIDELVQTHEFTLKSGTRDTPIHFIRFSGRAARYLVNALNHDYDRASDILAMITDNLRILKLRKIKSTINNIHRVVYAVADYIRENPDASTEKLRELFIPDEEDNLVTDVEGYVVLMEQIQENFGAE